MTAAVDTRNQLAALYASLALYAVPRSLDQEIGPRQALSWSLPDDGAISAPAVTFTIPADTTLTDFALFSASEPGELGDALIDTQTFEQTFTTGTELPVGFTYEQD